MRRAAPLSLVVALTLSAWAAPELAGRSAAAAVTQDQEYAAIQLLVGPAVNARRLLLPVLRAAGPDATADAAALRLTPRAFAAAQHHPMQMMDALQRYFQQFRGAPDAVTSLNSINQQFGFLDLSGLSAAAQTAVFMRLLTRPLASTYLRPPPAPPTCDLPHGTLVAPVFCPVVTFTPANRVPLYLPSWFPATPTGSAAFVAANNHQLWAIAVTSQSRCATLSCAAWYIQGIRGVSLRPSPDAVVELGAGGKGLLYLNRGTSSAPTVEWTSGGNTYIALGVDTSIRQTTLIRILRSLVRLSS